jgi:uncharacterized Zn-binding protein involved in type VI secretion
MEVGMKDIRKTVLDKVMENFIINKEAFMKENGKIIKCTVTENCIIATGSSHMKVSGTKMNLMVSEKFITTNLQCSTEVLIIQTLTILNSNGFTTMAS